MKIVLLWGKFGQFLNKMKTKSSNIKLCNSVAFITSIIKMDMKWKGEMKVFWELLNWLTGWKDKVERKKKITIKNKINFINKIKKNIYIFFSYVQLIKGNIVLKNE